MIYTFLIYILFISVTVFLVVGNIIEFLYWIKCLRIKYPCYNKKCIYKNYCRKHIELITQEEIDKIAKLIELYKKESENK